MHELGLGLEQTIYEVPASQMMLMLNQHALVNLGDERCMTLCDIEALESIGGTNG